MAATKKVVTGEKTTIPGVGIGKIYNDTKIISHCMPETAENNDTRASELTKPPETCWILYDMEDKKRFHSYMNDPGDITPKGAELLEMAKKISKERRLKRVKASTR